MASSVCAFAVSPAPATSFISPPLYRTSRQWRCVYSARQQKEPVRRLRKGLARFVVVLADEESDVQLGISRKRPPIAKPTTPRHFSTASVKLGSVPACTARPLYPQEQTSSGHPGMSVSARTGIGRAGAEALDRDDG